ncbi:MAG: magnesium transporter [Campylobacterales bacterium]|nr:magnesium transporter [Campylobacterales bacterium]
MSEKMKHSEIIAQLEEYIEHSKNSCELEFTLHESDVAEALEDIKRVDEEKFVYFVRNLPKEIIGEAIMELPEAYQEDLAKEFSAEELTDIVNELDTDDATDFVQLIEEQDEEKAYNVLQGVDEDHKEDIEVLKRYQENTAGSIMQVELISAKMTDTIQSTVERLRQLKAEDELDNVHFVFITDDNNKLLKIISLEDMILLDFDQTFEDAEKYLQEPIFVYSDEDTEEVANIVEKYNISVLPVVNNRKHLLGRITSDDIYDLIEENATDQIYSLANLDGEEELEDSVLETGKKRAWWLSINLATAIIASIVIGLFADTIDNIVALAVLMPIVASMGGIAGTQTLTVVVRQMALGEIDEKNAKITLKKEATIGIINGILFSIAATILAWVWFDKAILGAVMAVAMFVNLSFAAIFGATIPMVLKKMDIDPAVASGVLLTTITDVVGFFTFLGLATYVLL